MLSEFFSPGRWLVLLCALVLVAFLLGRFAPKKRWRLRPTVILFVLALVARIARGIFSLAGQRDYVEVAACIGDLLQLFVITNLSTILFFDLILLFFRLSLPSLMTDLVIGLAYIVAVIHTLHRIGLNLSGLIATSAVVSAVIGLSLAPTLGNVLGGVALQLDRSIHEGDWIQLDANTQGRVQAIRWRHTVIETRNWDTIIVPNSTLLSANIMILGKRSEQPVQRRYWVYFCVDFRFAPAQVIDAVNEALQCAPIPHVAREPKPHAICLDFGAAGFESVARYAVRYHLTDLALDDPTSSVIRERVYAALHRAGIPLAVPGNSVFLSLDDEAHKERKQAREQAKRVALLRGLSLFQPLNDQELDHIARSLVHAPFARGELMTQQGRVAHWLYLLVRGEADVIAKLPEGAPRLVRKITAPDFFGEMGLMTGAPRLADVVATVPSECYRLDKGSFQTVLMGRQELAAQLSAVLATRRTQLTAAIEDRAGEPIAADRLDAEKERILAEIQHFFGLAPEDYAP